MPKKRPRKYENARLPVLKSNRKTTYIVPKQNQDVAEPMPFVMDEITYGKILFHVNCTFSDFKWDKEDREDVKKFVNKLLPNSKNLYDAFKKYRKIFERKEIIKKRIKLFNTFNEKLLDMEDAKNNGLQVIKFKKRKEKREANKLYDALDEQIEKIELLIYLCVSPKRICIELKEMHPIIFKELNPIKYERWQEQTEYVERLQFAFKKSADEHMYASQEFLLEWLDKSKHPELDMQHVGIVREVALWKSRMAGFLNRKKFGNKVEILDDRPQVKVLDGKDLKGMLGALNNIADRINGKNNEEGGEVNMDEEYFDEEEVQELDSDIEFTEFEEINFEGENK